MTQSDRLGDYFGPRLAVALDELASPQFPEYFDDAVAVAVARRQRPGWTFVERWIPVSSLAPQVLGIRAVPWRTIALVVLLIALAVATAIVSYGLSHNLTPAPPFGPAANGLIAYVSDGDILTRDLRTSAEERLIGGWETDVAPFFSRDGLSLAWIRLQSDDADAGTLMVAKADGSDARALFGPAKIESATWSPRSDELAVISVADGRHSLSIVPTDADAAVRVLTLPVVPTANVEWRPPDGDELVFSGLDAGVAGLYAVRPDGTGFRQIAPSSGDPYWGPYEMTPDGSRMLYTQSGPITRVTVLDLETGERTPFGAALPPPADFNGSMQHHGAPTLMSDGDTVVFVRYWNLTDGAFQTQLWAGSLEADGADAVPISPLRDVAAGVNPYWQALAPDGSTVVVVENDSSTTWLADPDGGAPQELDWGEVGDPPSWQRVAP